MAKQDFEKFKQEIKVWLDTHQDEYDAFVTDINNKSYQSIQRIYALGIKMTPKLMAKSRAEIHGDVVPGEKEFDSFVADYGLAAQLVDEFHNVESSSIVPCLLSCSITANAMKRWSSDWKPTLVIPIVAERRNGFISS